MVPLKMQALSQLPAPLYEFNAAHNETGRFIFLWPSALGPCKLGKFGVGLYTGVFERA